MLSSPSTLSSASAPAFPPGQSPPPGHRLRRTSRRCGWMQRTDVKHPGTRLCHPPGQSPGGAGGDRSDM